MWWCALYQICGRYTQQEEGDRGVLSLFICPYQPESFTKLQQLFDFPP